MKSLNGNFMVKQNSFRLSLFFLALVFSACSSNNGPSMVSHGERGVATSNKDGVKTIEYITCKVNTGKKIVISDIKCKSSGCEQNSNINSNMQALLQLAGKATPDMSKIGDGLGNMLQTSLEKSGCFKVLDREAMESLKQEMALAGMQYKPERADILVSGAITSVSYSREKSAFGGGFIPLLGAITTDENKAKLGMDMKAIDVTTSQIVLSQDYMAESGQTKYGFMGGGFGGGGAFGGAFSSMNGTSMEEVARDVINRLTYDLVKQFAPNIYKIEIKKIDD